jgi:MMP 1-O-methyltransferase
VIGAREALALVEAIPGWMRPGDAEVLYRLAAKTRGPILEIGTYRGKSAVLMAEARAAADPQGPPHQIHTVDVERIALRAAHAEAARRGLQDQLVLVHGTSAAFARAHPHLRPALTFVDGDHSRPGTEADLAVLRRLVPADGLILFHDFDDPRDDDPGCPEIKVRSAVRASWVAEECRFLGVFGCCGLYRRYSAPAGGPVPVAELMTLAGVGEQYRHRLRGPAASVWRRVRRRRSEPT